MVGQAHSRRAGHAKKILSHSPRSVQSSGIPRSSRSLILRARPVSHCARWASGSALVAWTCRESLRSVVRQYEGWTIVSRGR